MVRKRYSLNSLPWMGVNQFQFVREPAGIKAFFRQRACPFGEIRPDERLAAGQVDPADAAQAEHDG